MVTSVHQHHSLTSTWYTHIYHTHRIVEMVITHLYLMPLSCALRTGKDGESHFPVVRNWKNNAVDIPCTESLLRARTELVPDLLGPKAKTSD